MTQPINFCGRFTVSLVLFLLLEPVSFGQNVPLRTLDNWMWHNENGWKISRKGSTTGRKRIQDGHQGDPAVFAGQSQADGPNVLRPGQGALLQEAVRRRRAAGGKWALSVRDADKKATSDAVFQCLFTLASIQTAQEHFAQAEPHLKRALWRFRRKNFPAAM